LAYKFDVEEAKDYLTVEAKGRVAKTVMDYAGHQRRGGPRHFGAGRGGGGDQGGRGGKQVKPARTKMDPKQRLKMQGMRGRAGMAAARTSSVPIEEDWLELEVAEFSALQKLTAAVPKGSDLFWAGELHAYDEDYDRLTSKTAKPLQRFETEKFYQVTTKDDEHMQEFVTEAEEDGGIYVTDSIMTTIMACTRSVYPWDIVISYLPGGNIFFDVRDALEAETNTHVVNETGASLPTEEDEEDLNSMQNLRIEATQIWQNFSQQVSFTVLCACCFLSPRSQHPVLADASA
jgi:translation initiation factor 3 subunit D